MDVLFRLKILAVFASIFWVSIYLISRKYDLESRGISLGIGSIMWRTERGLGYLDSLANRFKKFFRGFGVFSAIFGIGIMIVFFFLLFQGTAQGMMAFFSEDVALQIPQGAKTRPIILPGINIPFIVGIISLSVVLLVHEPAHGVILRRLKLKAKSTGLAIFLFVIPGAFVEQDDEEFEDAAPEKRMQVAGAGPMANIIAAIISLVLVIALVQPLPVVYTGAVAEGSAAHEAGIRVGSQVNSFDNYEIDGVESLEMALSEVEPGDNLLMGTEDNDFLFEIPREGVYINRVIEGSAADNAGISPNSRVDRLDGVDIDNLHELSMVLDDTSAGDNVLLETPDNQYSVILGQHPNENSGYLGVHLRFFDNVENFLNFEGYMGVSFLHSTSFPERNFLRPDLMFLASYGEIIGRSRIDNRVYDSIIPWPLIKLLKWIFSLSFLVALFNLLPLKPLDGGHIFEGLVEKISNSKKWASRFTKAISLVVLILIFFNFVILYA